MARSTPNPNTSDVGDITMRHKPGGANVPVQQHKARSKSNAQPRSDRSGKPGNRSVVAHKSEPNPMGKSVSPRFSGNKVKAVSKQNSRLTQDQRRYKNQVPK